MAQSWCRSADNRHAGAQRGRPWPSSAVRHGSVSDARLPLFMPRVAGCEIDEEQRRSWRQANIDRARARHKREYWPGRIARAAEEIVAYPRGPAAMNIGRLYWHTMLEMGTDAGVKSSSPYFTAALIAVLDYCPRYQGGTSCGMSRRRRK